MADKNYNIKDDEDYMKTNAGSTTECTGLMYAPPEGREEWIAYHQVFNFKPTADDAEIDEEDDNKPGD